MSTLQPDLRVSDRIQSASTGPLLGKVTGGPAVELREHGYVVRLARTQEEVEAAMRLRYEIFNLELGEGLAESEATGMDKDRFDAHCHHLLLMPEGSDEVVGTYRMQTRAMAQAGEGWYCDTEFELDALGDAALDLGVELGRACVSLKHRGGAALFALWRGVIRYCVMREARYIFGCCSLTSTDPETGRLADAWLRGRGKFNTKFNVPVRPNYSCGEQPVEPAELEAFSLPRLFASYVRYGSLPCSGPALDLEFGTVDFLVVFDMEDVEPRLRRLLFGD